MTESTITIHTHAPTPTVWILDIPEYNSMLFQSIGIKLPSIHERVEIECIAIIYNYA